MKLTTETSFSESRIITIVITEKKKQSQRVTIADEKIRRDPKQFLRHNTANLGEPQEFVHKILFFTL